ncbi:endonuclease-reverse transcriptase [Elysia marginata]|uniref:Endonuclease-reverse transcriptase n=1 Tax=Elysia marginata TaxID=1093978 RepID=A0AAV4G9V0_9GAST|nr:endonuclease-reverse transcriptase [Elysia marginata]
MKEFKKKGRRTQGQNGDPSTREKTSQSQILEARPQYDAPQPKPQRGSCAADVGKGEAKQISISTYNTRSLSHEDDLERLQEQLINFKLDIVGLSETKRKGEGLLELRNRRWIYEAGKTEDAPNAKGLALLINNNMKNFVEGFQRHSERIISFQIKLKGESLKVIQVYAPTSDYEDTEIEAFYEDLAKAMEMEGRGNIIIMGDFNAKIGTKKKEEDLEWIGCHCIGERNERGQRLLDFAAENKLYITNTFYQKPKSRYWTWESPGQQYRNQIDFILSTDKSLFKNTEVITSIDVGSDHRMVRGKIMLNKTLMRLKRLSKKKGSKIKIKHLEAVKETPDHACQQIQRTNGKTPIH